MVFERSNSTLFFTPANQPIPTKNEASKMKVAPAMLLITRRALGHNVAHPAM